MATSEHLNRIKGREPWRPLAPAILEKAFGTYFADAVASPFMTFAYPVRPERRRDIAAVVHVDGTTRPQVLTERSNARYRKVVEVFEAITGVPAVLNTSFNVEGEPLVCTVADAVRTFCASEIDELAIGPALLRKVD